MKWVNGLLGFVMFFLIVGGVFASPVEMDIFPDGQAVCPSNTVVYEISIKNIGPVRDTYDITSSSPDEITIAPSRITLESGEEFKDPWAWYTPRTTTKPGIYDFKIFATSRTTGERFSAEARIDVLACHDIDIVQLDPDISSCINEEAQIEMDIENEGRNTEKISLSTSEGNLNIKELELEPGTSQRVVLSLTGNSQGRKDVTIDARSLTSFARDTKLIELNVEKCYDSRLEVTPENKDVCVGKEGDFVVSLTNTGTKTDSFTLKTNGGDLEDTSLTVAPGETRETLVRFSPNSENAINLNVVAEGKSSNSASFIVKGVNCRSVTIIGSPSSQEICEDETGEVDLTIRNTGEVDDVFLLASNIGDLGESKLELSSERDALVDLEIDARKLDQGSHLVKVRARSLNNEVISDFSETRIDVLNCYDLNMNVFRTSDNIVGGDKILFENELKNTGQRGNTYKLNLEGPEWVSLRPEVVNLGPGESKNTFIHAAAPFDVRGEFDVVVTAEDESGTIRKIERFTLKAGEEGIEVSVPPKAISLEEFFVNIGKSIGEFFSKLEAPVGLIVSIVLGLIVVGFIIWRETK